MNTTTLTPDQMEAKIEELCAEFGGRFGSVEWVRDYGKSHSKLTQANADTLDGHWCVVFTNGEYRVHKWDADGNRLLIEAGLIVAEEME